MLQFYLFAIIFYLREQKLTVNPTILNVLQNQNILKLKSTKYIPAIIIYTD